MLASGYNFLKSNYLIVTLLSFYFFLLFFKSNGTYLLVADEAAYVGSVNSLFDGFVGNNNHPLLAKTIWLLFVSIFYVLTGTDNPAFWRVGTMVFSIGSLIVFYKILRIFFERNIALIGVLLLAIDPMFFVYSRVVMLDIPALFFLLLFLFFYLNYIKKKNTKFLLLSASALGLSLAVKLSALALIVVIPIFLFLKYKQFFPNLKKAFLEILKFESVVFLFYLIGNLIYFFKESSKDFLSYTISQILVEPKFHEALLKYPDSTSPAWSWFTIPQVLINYRVIQKTTVETIGAFQNPLLFTITIPLLIFTFYKLIKRKSPYNNLNFHVLLIFFCLFIPWLLPIRPTYYYYIIPVIPLIIILFLTTVSELKKLSSGILFAVSVASLAIFALYYSILVGKGISYKNEQILMSYSLFRFADRNSLTCQFCSPLRRPQEELSQ